MKRWLLPIIMIVVLAIGTFGAFAYFDSDIETDGHITAGTLTLKLGLSGSGPWEDDVVLPWDFTNLAPGGTISGDLWMKNTGSIPAKQVTFEWFGVTNTPEETLFAENLILTHIWDSRNTVDAIGQFNGVCDGPDTGTTCSLAELANLNVKYPQWAFDAATDVEPFLTGGNPQYLHMEFQFNPEADNTFQGAILSYGLIITAEQMHVFP